MTLNRRKFLKLAGVGCAALATPAVLFAESQPDVLMNEYPYGLHCPFFMAANSLMRAFPST